MANPGETTSDRWLRSMESLYYDDGIDPPDGWFIKHGRAYGESCHFGPFATLREAVEWANAHPHVSAQFVPLYLTLDWSR